MSSPGSEAARALAHARWKGKTPAERREAGRRVQDALRRRFEREIDPDRKLPAAELAVLVSERRRAHFAELGKRSAAAKAARRG